MAASDEFACVGDARGLGAMNAIEIVKDRITREPDRELTSAILSAALTKGLILIAAGAERNVIRVLVPLTAPFELIDEGLDILQAVIRSESSTLNRAQ
jgi:4-aminobutyrate aminotransferase-like enzyme